MASQLRDLRRETHRIEAMAALPPAIATKAPPPVLSQQPSAPREEVVLDVERGTVLQVAVMVCAGCGQQWVLRSATEKVMTPVARENGWRWMRGRGWVCGGCLS